jgi:hypothetical protein
VHNPPSGQNANNARHAIWHFGRTLTLEVFTSLNHKWRASDADLIDDGRHERGAPLVVQINAVWQPNTQKRGRGVVEEVSGGRSETSFIIHLDSHDPVNIAAAALHPTVFPNGIRLVDFDEVGTDGLFNFPMAIVYRGSRYKVKQPIALWEGGDEELHTDGAIYRAECQLWRDEHHERDARGQGPAWGPRL